MKKFMHPNTHSEYSHLINNNDLQEPGILKLFVSDSYPLTLIKQTLINIRRCRRKTIMLTDIPLDDKKTYALFTSMETKGIFYLDFIERRREVYDFGIDCIDDLVTYLGATFANLRPDIRKGDGVIEDIYEIIDRKHNRKPVTYIHPSLKSILEKTYGFILFNENIIRIAAQVAGFSLSWAELFEESYSVTGIEEIQIIEKGKALFTEGATSNGYSKAETEQIYEALNSSSFQALSKADIVSDALVTYRLAYLKANYPPEFTEALYSMEG